MRSRQPWPAGPHLLLALGLPAASASRAESGQLRVGAAKVDITSPENAIVNTFLDMMDEHTSSAAGSAPA
jgi:hypothetical protein